MAGRESHHSQNLHLKRLLHLLMREEKRSHLIEVKNNVILVLRVGQVEMFMLINAHTPEVLGEEEDNFPLYFSTRHGTTQLLP